MVKSEQQNTECLRHLLLIVIIFAFAQQRFKRTSAVSHFRYFKLRRGPRPYIPVKIYEVTGFAF